MFDIRQRAHVPEVDVFEMRCNFVDISGVIAIKFWQVHQSEDRAVLNTTLRILLKQIVVYILLSFWQLVFRLEILTIDKRNFATVSRDVDWLVMRRCPSKSILVSICASPRTSARVARTDSLVWIFRCGWESIVWKSNKIRTVLKSCNWDDTCGIPPAISNVFGWLWFPWHIRTMPMNILPTVAGKIFRAGSMILLFALLYVLNGRSNLYVEVIGRAFDCS